MSAHQQGVKRKADTPLGSPLEPGQILEKNEDSSKVRLKIRVRHAGSTCVSSVGRSPAWHLVTTHRGLPEAGQMGQPHPSEDASVRLRHASDAQTPVPTRRSCLCAPPTQLTAVATRGADPSRCHTPVAPRRLLLEAGPRHLLFLLMLSEKRTTFPFKCFGAISCGFSATFPESKNPGIK